VSPTNDDILPLWQALVEDILPSSPLLAGALEQALLSQFNAQNLELWLPERYARLLDDQDRRNIELAILRLYQWRPQIKLFHGPTPPHNKTSLAQLRKAQHEQHLHQQRLRIERDDLFVAALNIFQVPPDNVSIQLAATQPQDPTP
jgi:hypothetical protein